MVMLAVLLHRPGHRARYVMALQKVLRFIHFGKALLGVKNAGLVSTQGQNGEKNIFRFNHLNVESLLCHLIIKSYLRRFGDTVRF